MTISQMDDLFHQIVELSLDSIKEVSLDGTVRFVNAHGLARVAAENAERVIGASWASLWPPEEGHKVADALAAAARGERRQFEAECLTPSGEHRFWLVSTSPLRDPQGAVHGLLAVNRDVTARHRAEAALRTLTTALRDHAPSMVGTVFTEDLNEQLASAQQRSSDLQGELDIARVAQRVAETVAAQAQKGDAVGQLLAGTVHDLNNVLHVAGTAIEMVRTHGALVERDAALLQMADRAVQQGAAMSQRLLGFARHHPYRPQQVDVARVMEELMPLLQQAAGACISLAYQARISQALILVDPHSLERAVMNLVINARDACGERGRVTLVLDDRQVEQVPLEEQHAPGQYIVLSVQDDGPGIAPEVRKRLFEAYFTTKPVGTGTGLGLAQIRAAVRQADGFVEIDSEPGKGARFTLGFPQLMRA
ncbi:PAS domain-containing protein [Bacillus subtilis subsp. subtilis]|nr:PAS domain-containing protein [Bacillus subtilis subsp. subtilis]